MMNYEYKVMICRRAKELSEQTGSEVNIICLTKGDEIYAFLYDNKNFNECLKRFGRLASHPELSFTWDDAAFLSQKIRQRQEYNRSKEKESFKNSDRDYSFDSDGLDGYLSGDDFSSD